MNRALQLQERLLNLKEKPLIAVIVAQLFILWLFLWYCFFPTCFKERLRGAVASLMGKKVAAAKKPAAVLKKKKKLVSVDQDLKQIEEEIDEREQSCCSPLYRLFFIIVGVLRFFFVNSIKMVTLCVISVVSVILIELFQSFNGDYSAMRKHYESEL